MKLSDFKKRLENQTMISFKLPSGDYVPSHFHVTEVGGVSKSFIDCGGTVRTENRVNFQLWEANDYDHRLHPEKLVAIIELSEKTLLLKDEEIEVEYQGDTIGKYGLEWQDGEFVLVSLTTDCLAPDKCGVPVAKEKKSLASLSENKCVPGSGCC